MTEKTFYNIIPGRESCCILLYGYIGEYEDVRSGNFVRDLMEAEATYSKIDVRINSYGGEVYTGIAIVNALLNSKADITIYIDGVAASIASVIALCGKPLYMSKYSQLMIHSVSAGAWGTKGDLKKKLAEMEKLEETLAAMLALKMGKTEEEIRNEYFDEKDHWLTAAEAQAAGLIDGVYDTDPVPENSTPQQVYAAFMNRLNVQPTTNIMIEELKKRPAFANCVTQEDVLKNIANLEEKAGKADDFEKDNKTLKEENDALKLENEKIQTAEDEKVLNAARSEGRISEPEMTVYRTALKTDREGTTKILSELPKKRRIMDVVEINEPGDGKGAFDARKELIRNKTNQ